MQSNYFRKNIFLIVVFAFVLVFVPSLTRADRIGELEDEIDAKSKQIEEIQEEINQYAAELDVVRAEKQTLEGAIAELDLSRQKVSADINLTQSEIDNALFNIEKLTLEIAEKEAEININNEAIGEAIRRIHENESQTFVEALLGYDNLSDFWDELDSLDQFQVTVQQDLSELYALKEEFEEGKVVLQETEYELSQLQGQLVGQREVIDVNKAQKDELLDVTENEEATYQALLVDRIQQREIFEQELFEIEEELRITIDPDSLPSPGSGVLGWPLSDVLITQYFGNTPFASANPQVYNGNGHNGIDLAASTGSSVKAALSGTVTATGNTDLQAGCFSYGKWILITHNNGLSTLYAHLSVISVSPGESVKTGDTIGFSGNTGYSTGPHLHFSVFASDGVQVVRLGDVKTVTNCSNMEIPIAPPEAYLNPLSYL